MRRIWLLSLLAFPLLAGSSASIPTPAQAQDVLGILRTPMRMIQNLGVRGRLYHRNRRARPAATRAPEPRRGEAMREARPIPAGYWPDGFDDLFGYAFAPGTGDQFWQHGSFDILGAALAPSVSTRASLARRAAKAKNPCESNAARAEQTGAAFYQEIEKAAQPTEQQREAFKELRHAMITAARRIEASCAANFTSARPTERLRMLGDRLWAMRQATLVVRTPLEKAYDSLSDEQKKRLDGSNALAVSCTTDLAAVQAWPGAEIVRAVHPNDAQQAALDRFRGTFLGMSQWLASTCPQQPSETVIARLDAAGDRLNAVLYVTRMVNRALTGVYAALNDEQEARLQAVGRQLRLGPPRAEVSAR